MTLITTTEKLAEFCALCKDAPYITVDTEFLREKTYYPKLCLVQIGVTDPYIKGGAAVAIDTLSDDLNLAPLEDLFFNDEIIKVFHAARQDLEIFVEMFGRVPAPLFDTQVAAMVTGYGDQIGYQSLVKQICGQDLDKSNQFTDWSRRPLTEDQLTYALADVTWLRQIYEHLRDLLDETGRWHWIEEEMTALHDTDTHRTDPDEIWQKVKIRSDKPKILAALKALAAWRERRAMDRDKPRSFILRDEVISEVARQLPKSEKDLGLIRGMPQTFQSGAQAALLLETVKTALSTPKSTWPKKPKPKPLPQEQGPALEMLKMLLKIQASAHNVVPRLICNVDELQALLMHDEERIKELQIMHGWRYEVFGQYATSLISGDISLTLQNGQIRHIATPQS